MKPLSTLPPLKGARVLVRVDYNVPFKGSKIADTRRIDASVDTIRTIIKKGGTPVLIAHLGDESATLRPVATYLSKSFKTVFVTEDVMSTKIEEILDQVPTSTVILLENIRRYEGEEKNTASFARRLAALGAYYVNDAFSVSHRAHASVVGIPKYLPSYAGVQLIKEVEALAPVVAHPQHPFVFILGGAKFATKIPLIGRFIDTADHVVIVGALLNSFYKTLGFEVGKSVVEDGYEKEIKKLAKKPNLLLPVDVIVMRGTKKVVCTPDEIQTKDVVVDIGPQSVALINQKIVKAKLVVWNGPTGWYEKGFTKATTDIAKAIAQSKARAVIGGGDTGVVVEKALKGDHKRIFVSTGGGATIDFLATGTLPGIKALG
jgi:phosphoglycerate kinase